MKKVFLMIMAVFSLHMYGQTIPLPQRCYTLNDSQGTEVMNNQAATVKGKVKAIEDRLGAASRAMSFDDANSCLILPELPSSITERGATVTFWMRVDKEAIAQAFWGKDSQGEVMLGMYKNQDRAVLGMHHTDFEDNILPDQQWMWDDSNFSEGSGWYFVAIAYASSGTTFYMTTPKGKMTYCYSAFVPHWDKITSWGIGSVGDKIGSGIDDFKIYASALSKEQIETLYHAEAKMTSGASPLTNVHTGTLLLSSPNWYFHCIGKGDDQILQFAIQQGNENTFLCGGAGNGTSLSDDPENSKWQFWHQGDTDRGQLYILSDVVSGMNITAKDGNDDLCGATGADDQKWCMGIVDATEQVAVREQSKNAALIKENVCFDSKDRLIRIKVLLPEIANVEIIVYDSAGRTVASFAEDQNTYIERSFSPASAGVYVVSVRSDNYDHSTKVNVTSLK